MPQLYLSSMHAKHPITCVIYLTSTNNPYIGREKKPGKCCHRRLSLTSFSTMPVVWAWPFHLHLRSSPSMGGPEPPPVSSSPLSATATSSTGSSMEPIGHRPLVTTKQPACCVFVWAPSYTIVYPSMGCISVPMQETYGMSLATNMLAIAPHGNKTDNR